MASKYPLEVLDEREIIRMGVARSLYHQSRAVVGRFIESHHSCSVHQAPKPGASKSITVLAKSTAAWLSNRRPPVRLTTASATVRFPDAGGPWRKRTFIGYSYPALCA